MDSSAVGVQGIETVCADQGVGTPVLFVHGWGGWHQYWRHVWPRMVPRFRSLAVDLPGFGWSEKPDNRSPFTLEWYADWLGALLDVKKASPAVVVGHSMGGTVSTLLALRHPEKVERLVLINPIAHGATALSGRTKFLTAPGVRQIMFGLTRFDSGLAVVGEGFTSVKPMELEDLRSIRMASFRALTASLTSLKGADLTAVAGQVKVPTVVMTSTDDRIVDPLQGASLAKAIPGARHRLLAGVGHCAQLEAPEAVASALLEALADLPRPGRPRQW
jgi:pimeloyl-ACP methyl ester carboxylesterase